MSRILYQNTWIAMLKTRQTVLIYLRLNSWWLLHQKSRWKISRSWIGLIGLWKTRPGMICIFVLYHSSFVPCWGPQRHHRSLFSVPSNRGCSTHCPVEDCLKVLLFDLPEEQKGLVSYSLKQIATTMRQKSRLWWSFCLSFDWSIFRDLSVSNSE